MTFVHYATKVKGSLSACPLPPYLCQCESRDSRANCVNPCPCGFYGDDRKECTCFMGFVQRYQKHISGPLMDRIVIHLEVQCVPFEKLSSLDGGEPSSAMRARVEAARAVQAERFAPLGKPHVLVNGDMRPAEVQRFCQVDEEGKSLMRGSASDGLERTVVSSCVKAGAHDCRSGG